MLPVSNNPDVSVPPDRVTLGATSIDSEACEELGFRMDADELYALIDVLHEGVADDEHWLFALDRLSDAFGAAAMFLGATQRSGTGFELSGHRMDPQWIEMVNGGLAGHDNNPIFSTVSRELRADPVNTVMRPLRISQLLDAESYHASPLYRQAIEPAGYDHVLVLVLSVDAASALSLTIVRPRSQADFSDEELRFATLVGPHIVTALRMRHRHAIARSSAMMLDRFDQGVLLLSVSGHVVHSNSEAERLLREGDGLQVVNGELRAARPADTKRLRQTISETDRAARGASLVPEITLRLERPSGLPELVVRALPVAPVVASTFGVGELATVALFIHDPDRGHAAIEDLIARGLGLTAAEAAAVARIWEGDTVTQAAATLGISPNTVKSHLKAVYDKLDVDRQSSLVRRVAMMLAAVGR